MPQASMNRRAWLNHVLWLVGAAAVPMPAMESLAATHTARRKKTTRHFLNAAQFAAVSAIADTMLPTTDTPGAVAAQVPQRLDSLLRNWASADSKAQLVGAIAAIDRHTMASDKKLFAALTPERRKEVLAAYDAEALKPGPAPAGKSSGLLAVMAGPSVVNPDYARLKDLIVSLYYSSEIALTHEHIYEHVPGAWVASLKITAGMRPFAAIGRL